jgi:hypothetical protein
VDDRQDAVLGIGFDPLADLEAVHVGELDVEHDQVDVDLGEPLQGLLAGLRLDHREAGPRQPAHQQVTLGGAVVDDQHRRGGHG